MTTPRGIEERKAVVRGIRTKGPKAYAARVAVVAVLAAAALAAGCARQKKVKTAITTEPVVRRDIAVTVEATGTVEPINLVEVKSKASGQIVQMPVEIGSTVRKGALMAQIDTRDVRNAYEQTRAAMVAAQARVQVTRAQRQRSDQLFKEQVITAAEHETATLDDADSRAQLVRARTDMDLARQRLEDATVSAPIAGTVLTKSVAVGQVISSATSSVSGGTTLLQMADLSRIRVRAMVSETDIGRVRPGEGATVVVDAYPNRTFEGSVEKIEPQAVVDQSVTMFPVLVSIANEQGLLLPGMNGEVTVMIDQRENVLSVPVDALRNVREVGALAKTLGIDTDSLNAQVEAARGRAMAAAASDSGRGGRFAGAASGAGAANGAGAAGGGRFADASAGANAQDRGGWRGRRMRGDSTGAGWSGRAGSGRGDWANGGGGRRGMRGMRGDSTRAGRQGGGAGAGGGGFAGGAFTGGAGGGGGMGGGRSRTQIAVVKTEKGYAPRVVRVGVSNYDYAEVVSGLAEGENVVLLAVVDLQQQRTESMDRIRNRMGGGVPGAPGAGGGGRGAGGRGTGGGGGGR